MAVNERATALAPYVERLLYSEEAQDALRQVASTTRETYRRARSKKDPRQAVKDKKLQRGLRQSVEDTRELWSAMTKPPSPRYPRWVLGFVVLAMVAAGTVFALNAGARQRVLEKVSKKNA